MLNEVRHEVKHNVKCEMALNMLTITNLPVTDIAEVTDCYSKLIRGKSKRVYGIIAAVGGTVKGLRQAKLGAVFAIRAHWIVSKKAATVVMPTGTGKTETMITTIVAEQCKKYLYGAIRSIKSTDSRKLR